MLNFNLVEKLKIKNLFNWSSMKKGNLEIQQKQKQGSSSAIQQTGTGHSEAHIGDKKQPIVIKDLVVNIFISR